MNSDQQIPDPHDHHDEHAAHDEHAEHAEHAAGAAPQHGFEGERPFGFWLKLVDRRLSEEMDALFADDGLTRRDWRMLNLLAGEARDERLEAKLQAKPGMLHELAERGWVEGTPPTLTTSGREALEQLTARVSALRARIAGAASPEDFATTLATLEAVARELGWDESQPMPRGHRGGRGFGRRHGGFARFGGFGGFGGFGDRSRSGHGEGHDPREHHDRGARHDRGECRDRGEHGRGYGHEHGRGHFGRPGLDPRDRAAYAGQTDPREQFAPHEHGRPGKPERFGGRRHPHRDVHVHVHLHDGPRRPQRDA